MGVAVGQHVSHYHLLEKLGEGGMGVVWKAHDLRLDRDVAIKLLPERFAGDPDRKARFEREAKAVAALRHPNIVTIYAVEEADGLLFFTMELLDGEPLSRRIVPGGIPPEDFLVVAAPIAEAIAAAHERGIIHRDLKPSNIMICAGGIVKILDFGLARFVDRGVLHGGREDATTASRDSGLDGTLRYMSPEQLRGEPLDHRSDLFSLGVVLFELATGEHPFGGATAADAIAAVLKDEPPSASAINPRMPRVIDDALKRCLEKDPARRTPSAASLMNDLRRVREDDSAAPPSADPSIAVLPPADMSPEQDQAYFCEGMAEEIINALSRIRGLRVASRTSSFQFKNGGADTREIGRRLGVGTLLEGSVRKSGPRLRITAQLVDAARGFHLWSETFDREMEDVFEIQREIAEAVAGALQVTLSPQEKGALVEAPTRHVQAYDYYLRGRNYYYRYGRRDIEFALQLFSRAIELDPSYALAHAGLADCWSYIYLYSERRPGVREQAEAAARRAVELAPESAQALASLAVALSLGGRRDDAERAFERAIRLDPRLFEAWYFYARHSFGEGQLEKAARLYERAAEVCPEDYQAPLLVAQIDDDLGRRDKARAERIRGIACVEARLELHPDDARALYMAANGLVALGDRKRGLEFAGRARAIAPEEPMLLYNLGCIYSLAGEHDEALDCLEKAVGYGLTHEGWFEHDSNLDPLRGLPRFKALLERLRSTHGSARRC